MPKELDSLIQRTLTDVKAEQEVNQLGKGKIEQEEAVLEPQCIQARSKLKELAASTEKKQSTILEHNSKLEELRTKYKTLVETNLLMDELGSDPEEWSREHSSATSLDSDSSLDFTKKSEEPKLKKDYQTVIDILKGKKSNLDANYAHNRDQKEKIAQTLRGLIQKLTENAKDDKTQLFDFLLKYTKDDKLFLEDLLSIEVITSLNNTRHLRYYYQHKKNPKGQEYAQVLEALVKGIRNKLAVVETFQKKLKETFDTKLKGIEDLSCVVSEINNRLKLKKQLAAELQSEQTHIKDLRPQVEQLEENQAALTEKKKPLLVKLQISPVFLTSLKSMKELLEAQKQTLGSEDSETVGTISWEAWEKLHKTQQALILESKSVQEVNDSELGQQLTVINQELETHLFNSLNTCFKQYNTLLLRIRKLTPIQTGEGFYAFLKGREDLNEALKTLESQVNAYFGMFSPLELEHEFQRKINAFKEQLTEANSSKTELVYTASSQLANQVADYRRVIERESDLTSLESVEALESVSVSTEFETAQKNLDSMYECLFSLSSFIRESTPEFKDDFVEEDIKKYRYQVVIRKQFDARHAFYKQELLKDYSTLLNGLDQTKVGNYLRSGNPVEILDEIEARLPNLKEALKLKAYCLIIKLSDYKQDKNTPAFKVLDNNSEYTFYSYENTYLDIDQSPNLEKHPKTSPHKILESFINRDKNYGEVIEGLNHQIKTMDEKAKQLNNKDHKEELEEYTLIKRKLKNEIDRLEGFIKRDTNYIKAIKSLYQQIKKMDEYRKQLKDTGHKSDSEAYSLILEKFKADINYFVLEHRFRTPSPKEISNFKRLILARIHTEYNNSGNHHSGEWKRTVLNWLLVPLRALQAVYSYFKTGHCCTLFANKTHRQELLDEFEEKTNLFVST